MPIEISWQQGSDRNGARRRRLDGSGEFWIGRATGSNVQLDDPQVSREHALIRIDGTRVTIEHRGTNPTTLAGRPLETRRATAWREGDEVRIGPFSLRYRQVEAAAQQAPRQDRDDRTPDNERNRDAGRGGGREPRESPQAEAAADRFPGRLFQSRTVAIRDIQASRKHIEECDFAAVGGGIGSFIWIDHLRVFGVPARAIRAIGVAPDKKPYNKWGRLCKISQIPDHERIRSNSISTPDNIWGFPGYASREAVRDVLHGRLAGIKYLLQVFGEPALTESYTPRLADVFRSFDREARRIGWDDMYLQGQVVGIRKTDDERYVIAYRALRTDGSVNQANESPAERTERERFVVARYVHIALGWGASNFLPDLQKFKRENPNSQAVVNAYEPHDHVYRTLEQRGGTVLIRGRGIVASRVIQRIFETRANNDKIQLLHLNRSHIREGRKYDLAQRTARNNVEQQPFNWPKAAWGGTLRKRLEQAPPEERARLLTQWDGSHTADRGDWNEIIEKGTAEGWYKSAFGIVEAISEKNGRLVTRLKSTDTQGTVDLVADFVIDCTGLVSKLEETPLLADLIRTYEVKRNLAGDGGNENSLAGLAVTNSFEIPELRNGRGRAYAAGTVASRGPYAAVDSFLGLAYAALRSVDHLSWLKAPGVSRLGPFRSAYQWTKWCVGRSP